MNTASKKKLLRNFTKPTQISRHLYCPVCSDVFRDPVRLFCTHTFCRECIDTWKQTKATCPVCVQSIASELITEDRLAAKIIDDLEVSCINKLCDWRDRLELLEKHANSCVFEKNVPKWIEELRSDAHVKRDQSHEDIIFGTSNDALYEKLNEEMPRGSLTERLLKKDTKNLKIIKSIVASKDEEQPKSSKKTTKKTKSLLEIESIFAIGTSDEEMANVKEGGTENNLERQKIEEEIKSVDKTTASIAQEEYSNRGFSIESTKYEDSRLGSDSKGINLTAIMEEDYDISVDHDITEDADDSKTTANTRSESKQKSTRSRASANSTGDTQESISNQLKQESRTRRGKLERGSVKKSKTVSY